MIVYDIENLNKIYAGSPESANKNISLQIVQGEVFGLLGDNGAGKSTLVRQMVNLLQPTSGQIRFLGHPLPSASRLVPMNVGYMPQGHLALNHLTVSETLFHTAYLRGLNRKKAQDERDRLLDLLQIEQLHSKLNERLSGGERRLLQLAVAMVGSLPTLILDEPTNELSPQRRRQVWSVLRHLNQKEGTTIIFVTHDATEAEKIIQRVGIMHDGELVVLGKPSDLKQQLEQKLRLEIQFSPEIPPVLPADVTVQELDTGRWLVLLQRYQLEDMIACLDHNRIDDFHLSSTTLEDLYLHHADSH